MILIHIINKQLSKLGITLVVSKLEKYDHVEYDYQIKKIISDASKSTKKIFRLVIGH